MLDMLKGKKTYIAAAGMALSALAAYLGDAIDGATLVQRLVEAVGLATLRAGVKKIEG